MKWSEVRKMYPDQFVKLKVPPSHVEDNQEIVEDTAVIRSIPDESATY